MASITAFDNQPERLAELNGLDQLIDKIQVDHLYRTKEVAALLSCSVRYVQLLVELGRLESLRVGRLIRIPGQDLVHFIERYMDWHAR